MEDIFYFSKAHIKLEDMAKHAEGFGYLCKIFTDSDRWLNVYYNDQDFWQWSELKKEEGDYDSFESLQQKKISEFRPVSAFAISHHAVSLPNLLVFLKHILLQYDGWVGCDDGRFAEIYHSENIENLRYPYELQ